MGKRKITLKEMKRRKQRKLNSLKITANYEEQRKSGILDFFKRWVEMVQKDQPKALPLSSGRRIDFKPVITKISFGGGDNGQSGE